MYLKIKISNGLVHYWYYYIILVQYVDTNLMYKTEICAISKKG